MQDLIVVEDIVRLQDCSDGFVVVKEDRVILNGDSYDVAAGHSLWEVKADRFYSIPIETCNSSDFIDICVFVLKRWMVTYREKYFVRIPGKELPQLMEVGREIVPINSEFSKTGVCGVKILTTTFDRILPNCGEEGKRLKRQLQDIAQEWWVALAE